jgi:EAL domain-containing protein (putative c-di-GMP-specific phosphodiesterase class I)
MHPLFIPQLTKKAHVDLKQSLLNPNSIHEYQPFINNKNQIIGFELKPSALLSSLYSNGYSRNEYLYELRSVLDAVSLIKKYPTNQFELEVNVSYETIEMDDFIDCLEDISRNQMVANRIILSVTNKKERYPHQKKFISNRLASLASRGFKLMYKTESLDFPMSALKREVDYFKLISKHCDSENIEVISKLIVYICKELNAMVCFYDIESKSNFEVIPVNDYTLLQGSHIGKPKRSLINSKYDFI